MTDRDRLLTLLTDFGIEPSKSTYLPHPFRDDSYVVLCAGDGGVIGDDDYYCVFTFDERGAFVSVEVRE